MATDEPDPEECDPEIIKAGETVAYAEVSDAAQFSRWVVMVRQASGQRVDWHYVAGGRAAVKVIGDTFAAKKAMVDLQHLHAGVIVYGKPRWRR